MSKAVAMLIPFLGTVAAQALAADDETCRSSSITAATQSFVKLDRKDQESFYYSHACIDRRSSGSSGFDVFVDAVMEKAPLKNGVGAQGSKSSTSQWCEENKQYARDKSFAFGIYKTVFAPAIASFNNCVAATNANLAVTVKPLNDYHFVVSMKNNSRKAEFQGVKINPENLATCEVAYQGKTHKGSAEKLSFSFDVGETITFDCIRRSQDGKFYPAVSFDFRNELQNYTYVMARYDQGSVEKKAIEPDKHLTPVNGAIVNAAAYWAGGHKSYTRKCMADPEYMTFVGTLSTKVQTGGPVPECLSGVDFQGNEPCTGGDEYCTITTAKGCYVSADWLNWYRDFVASKGLEVSNDQICSPKDRG